MTIEQLIAQINVIVRTDFNRNYQDFEPEFKDLLHEYESGPVASNNFVFSDFLAGIEKFTGSRKHNLFPDAYKFPIVNEEWDHAVDINRKDLERAAAIGSIQPLNIYTQRIGDMPKMWADQPIELAFDMLDAGTASTYGLTFDGQTFFDTDHSYTTTSGTQSNIVTGGGATTVALLIADIQACWARFDGFTYNQGGTTNAKKRKLNKSMNNVLIVAPTQLGSLFRTALTQNFLASGESNPVAGRFKLVTRAMSDANDWYMIILDDPFFRPFLFQVEKRVELDTPTPQDESARERKIFTWGGYARHAVAYGSWWTAIKVTNT